MDVTFVGEREMVVKDALKLQSWPELRTLENSKRDFAVSFACQAYERIALLGP